MKKICKEGIGSKKWQAEVISEVEEYLMWSKGLLGDDTPQRLLDTVLFYNGLYFALRSGQEHQQLQNRPCQIELIGDQVRSHISSTLKTCQQFAQVA